MVNVKIKNALRVLYYGWSNAKKISSKDIVKKNRLLIYFDMFQCFLKYDTLSSQYYEFEMYKLSQIEKRELGKQILKLNIERDRFEEVYNKNWTFLNKYTKFYWETSNKKKIKRNNAYIRHFHLGKQCWIQYGVTFICEHGSVGSLNVGDNILFARNVDIDYTGNLTIGEGSLLSENVKILTHNHSYFEEEDNHGLILTPLIIRDHVIFGARVMVLPGVEEIGRGAILSAGAVIRKKVPPYAIVVGNPSKVVGFRYTPEQILEYEEEHYPVEKRLSEDLLQENYKKYYLDKIEEIKQFLS